MFLISPQSSQWVKTTIGEVFNSKQTKKQLPKLPRKILSTWLSTTTQFQNDNGSHFYLSGAGKLIYSLDNIHKWRVEFPCTIIMCMFGLDLHIFSWKRYEVERSDDWWEENRGKWTCIQIIHDSNKLNVRIVIPMVSYKKSKMWSVWPQSILKPGANGRVVVVVRS